MTYTTAYDHWLQTNWEAHMPAEYPWEWFKAQMLAESNGNPNARSPVGAMGLFQFMPDTWNDVKEALNFPSIASPLDPQQAIQGAAWYMRQLWDKWTAPRPPLDRLQLAFASYNAGFGNVVAAQRVARSFVAKSINNYLTIVQYLPQVTGAANAAQTSGYITRIGAIYLTLTDATLPQPS